MNVIRFTSISAALSALLLASALTSAADVSPPQGIPATTASASHSFTPAQLDEMQARIDLANTIVQNVAGDASAKGATESWRMGLLSDLYNAPSASLRHIAETVTSLDEAHTLAATAGRQNAATTAFAKNLGSSTDSLVFTPIAPCRFIDTRNAGPALSTTPRTFNTINGGTTYGGNVGCVLPTALTPGIAANVTVTVAGGAAGYVVLRPAGSSEMTSFINWPTGGTAGLANAGIIATSSVSSGGYAFEALANAANTPQLIVDLFGYFAAATVSFNSFDCYGITNRNVSAPANYNTYYASGTCAAGYVAVTPYCFNNSNAGVFSTGSGILYNTGNGTQAFCGFDNTESSAVTVSVGAQCCRSAGY